MEKLKRNPSQEKAINTTEGPVILISCPGSGKTTTLINRIGNIISKGVDPEKVLMVTFSKKAADEMEARYKKKFGEQGGVNFSTIHGLCLLILKEEYGYTQENIISENEKRDFILNYIKNDPTVADAWELTKNILNEISLIKNNYVNLKTYKAKSCETSYFIQVYKAYENEKKITNRIDFDDMLTQCQRMFVENPKILKKWQQRFDYIMVDEYQDTNEIQRDILYGLIQRTKNICVVGDDDQCIYSFRGANSSIMMNFDKDFKNATSIYMSTNYRSAQNIVNIAETLITQNIKRFPKDFISERGKNGERGHIQYNSYQSRGAEMHDLVGRIKLMHQRGIAFKDMAVLVRNNRQADGPVQALSEARIPYDSTEEIKSVYEDYIFEDIKSYIDLSMGKSVHKNLLHVLNRPNRFLKQQPFLEVEYNTDALLNAIQYIKNEPDAWKYATAEKSIFDLINWFGPGEINRDTPCEKVFNGLEKLRYRKYLKDSTEFKNGDVDETMADYEKLKNDALKYETVGKWLDYANRVTYMIRQENDKNDSEGVCITTMHRSKGCEWKVVFLIGVNDGILPSKNAIEKAEKEEERRILYVAMTRAKDYLFITSCGNESEFMLQTLKRYKEKFAPAITKKLAGTKVQLADGRIGTVVNYKGNTIQLRIDGNVENYAFPADFENKKLKYI